MPVFRYDESFQRSNDPIFDTLYSPGGPTPCSGIYRCEGCGHEVIGERGRTLPLQSHHPHSSKDGVMRWRLIVCTTHR